MLPSSHNASVLPPFGGSITSHPYQPQPVTLTVNPSPAQLQNYVVPVAGSININPGGSDEPVPVSIHVSNVVTAGPGLGPSAPSHNLNNGGAAESGGGGGGGGGNSAQDGALKVEDALNYLDQVKLIFGNEPQVYNDFLDIMKEFKSQSIDTPGVISRVSKLFRGHPQLIMGFNTFLPPGYKIEVQMHPAGSAMSQSGMNYKVKTVYTFGGYGAGGGGARGNDEYEYNSPVAPPAPTQAQHGPGPVQVQGPGPAIVTNYARCISPGNVSSAAAAPPSAVTIKALPVVNRPPSFDNVTVTGSPFTHSLASPFVENAFPTLQSQPLEFNHAITYVNKIKNRFHNQPEKYREFLEILHTYQKEVRNSKDAAAAGSTAENLTEHEVYNQVAKLFENQEDLLQEFGAFLPEAMPRSVAAASAAASCVPAPTPPSSVVSSVKSTKKAKDVKKGPKKLKMSKMSKEALASKNAPEPVQVAPPPHPEIPKDGQEDGLMDLTDVGQYGNLNDFAFFDKVRHFLRAPEVYDNFLRILLLYNDEVISRSEVLQLASPFLSKAPELMAWFQTFLGLDEMEEAMESDEQAQAKSLMVEDKKVMKIAEEKVVEIDYSNCERLGASYCAMPRNRFIPPQCSGRTDLCREVLNDIWISVPSTNNNSNANAAVGEDDTPAPPTPRQKKSQLEEYNYRCEDERFELDVVIGANSDTIRCLEAVKKQMARMSQKELQEFQLDDCLGGTSPTIHQGAIRRLYGEKAGDIIEGLKKLPTITIPLVLKRLKAKEEEWREAQKGFNKIWREQIERFTAKSQDQPQDREEVNMKSDIRHGSG